MFTTLLLKSRNKIGYSDSHFSFNVHFPAIFTLYYREKQGWRRPNSALAVPKDADWKENNDRLESC